jgi:hypothetical protein
MRVTFYPVLYFVISPHSCCESPIILFFIPDGHTKETATPAAAKKKETTPVPAPVRLLCTLYVCSRIHESSEMSEIDSFITGISQTRESL